MSSIIDKIQRNVPLKPLTTFRIGGPAQYFFFAETEEDLAAAIVWATVQKLPFFLLGAGSNILVADEGFPGLVVKLGNGFASISFDEKNNQVTAGAAVLLPGLGKTLTDLGWEGFEFMCGIPGTIGGAVVMNAGTKNGEIKDVLATARVMRMDGTVHSLACNELEFGHRTSYFKKSSDLILSVTFTLSKREDPLLLRERVRKSLADRSAKQPKNSRNCGSVFKSVNDGMQAWKYIDKAGFKGTSEGDALVAEEHANWIINRGSATAADVKNLIRNIQTEVKEKFDVSLEREVIFIPEDILK